MTKKVIIWGAGNNASLVFAALNKERCSVIAFIDSNEKKQGQEWCKGIFICSPKYLLERNFDYVIISPDNYTSILETCLSVLNIPEEKLIAFWDKNKQIDIIDYKYREMHELSFVVKKYTARTENARYEYAQEDAPVVKSALELLEIIKTEGCSLCRYGDGEFEMMRMKDRPWFQSTNPVLAERLKEVFYSQNNRVLISIADNFGKLDRYTEEAADDIRLYLSGGTRQELIKIIDKDRLYYDAYVTRPYLIYRDKGWAEKVFASMKEIWRGRKVLIVEGEYSRLGMGNDLLSEACSIRRVICPAQNAFDTYEKILQTVSENVIRNELVLVSLGPTATVLAYDLALLGIQALDIGQIDNEYEWYLKGAKCREAVKGKMVAELFVSEIGDFEDIELAKEYEAQIIATVGVKNPAMINQ